MADKTFFIVLCGTERAMHTEKFIRISSLIGKEGASPVCEQNE